MNSDQHDTPGRIRQAAKPVERMTEDALVGVERHRYSFANVRGYIVGAVGLIRALAATDLEAVPEPILQKVETAEHNLVKQLEEIEAFHKRSDTSTAVRDTLENTLRNVYNTFFDAAAPIIAFGRQNEVNNPARERMAGARDARPPE
jgi:hypothetical protein